MRIRVTTALFALGLFVAGAAAYASEPEVSIRTRPTVARVGQPFNIIVQTSGSPVGVFSLPTVDGLTIDPNPAGMSSRLGYADGRTFAIGETRFVAVAREPGVLSIPPVYVEIAGQRVASNAVDIEIIPADAPASPDADPDGQRAIPIQEAMFIRTEVDKVEVYQGEPILMGLALWQVTGIRAGTRRGSVVAPPEMTGFYVVDLPPIQEVRDRLVEDAPFRYEVRQTRRMLFPTATGTLTIGGWNLEGYIQVPDRTSALGFDSRQRVQPMRAEPVEITVKPLPQRPARFSGAVGQFTLRTEISQQQSYLGQPITLAYEVRGLGNPGAIGAPYLPPIDGIHVSSPRTTTDLSRTHDSLEVTKRFEYTLTPNTMGDVAIPAAQFIYFDPQQSDYLTLEGREYQVRIGRPAQETARTFVSPDDPEGEQLALLRDEIAPPLPAPASLSRRSGFEGVFLAAGYGLPVLAYAALAAVAARRRRFERDAAYARSQTAQGRLSQRLREVRTSPEPEIALYRALAGYVADKLNIADAAMTPADIDAHCREHGLSVEATEGIVKTLRACERVRYSGGQLSSQELEALVDAAELHLDQFDTAIREQTAS